jgi:hypothetical protein
MRYKPPGNPRRPGQRKEDPDEQKRQLAKVRIRECCRELGTDIEDIAPKDRPGEVAVNLRDHSI